MDIYILQMSVISLCEASTQDRSSKGFREAKEAGSIYLAFGSIDPMIEQDE